MNKPSAFNNWFYTTLCLAALVAAAAVVWPTLITPLAIASIITFIAVAIVSIWVAQYPDEALKTLSRTLRISARQSWYISILSTVAACGFSLLTIWVVQTALTWVYLWQGGLAIAALTLALTTNWAYCAGYERALANEKLAEAKQLESQGQ